MLKLMSNKIYYNKMNKLFKIKTNLMSINNKLYSYKEIFNKINMLTIILILQQIQIMKIY